MASRKVCDKNLGTAQKCEAVNIQIHENARFSAEMTIFLLISAENPHYLYIFAADL